MDVTFLGTSYKWNMFVLVFWLISHSIMSLRFIHVAACIRISFLRLSNSFFQFLSLYIYICHILLIPLHINENLSWFCFGCCIILLMNTSVQVSLWDLAFNSFGFIPSSEIAGSVILFNFLMNCHTVFPSGYTIYISPSCTRVPISPHPCQHLLLASVLFWFSQLPSLWVWHSISLWFAFAF